MTMDDQRGEAILYVAQWLGVSHPRAYVMLKIILTFTTPSVALKAAGTIGHKKTLSKRLHHLHHHELCFQESNET